MTYASICHSFLHISLLLPMISRIEHFTVNIQQKQKKQLSDAFSIFYLHICKKSSTFARNLAMKRNGLIFGLLGVTLVLLFGLDVCKGGTEWMWPLGQTNEIDGKIIQEIRLPKAITAILAGAALSISGLMMQTLFRNPLAGPYTLGVSAGASLGVALLTMLGSGLLFFNIQLSAFALPIAACIGASLVLLLVLAVSSRVQNNVSLLIVGMMFGAIAGALVSVLQQFANPDALKMFIVWTMGSLDSVAWSDMRLLIPILLLGTIFVLFLMKPLNGLLLGEDYARGLGIHVGRTRLFIVLATGLLAGGITAFCGPIAFIGVAVPHIARGIFHSSNHRITIPACTLIGACLLLVCDVICHLFVHPLPIMTVSALFGAPIIIWIIMKNK